MVFDKKEASTNPENTEKAEKKLKIYGISRRDPTLSGKCSSSPKDDFNNDTWTEDGESWDGPGLDKWDYADEDE